MRVTGEFHACVPAAASVSISFNWKKLAGKNLHTFSREIDLITGPTVHGASSKAASRSNSFCTSDESQSMNYGAHAIVGH